MLLFYKPYGCSDDIPNSYLSKIEYGYECLEKLYLHLGSEGDERLRKHLRANYEPVSLKSKYKLATTGEFMEYGYFLIEGTMSVFSKVNGRKQILRLHTPGNFLMSPEGILHSGASAVCMQTESTSLALRISTLRIQQFFKGKPPINYYLLMQNLLSKFLIYQRELSTILQMRAPERFDAIKKAFPVMIDTFSQKDIASLFGMQPETFTRIKNRIENK